MTVQAMKAGAVDSLTKPVRAQTLHDAVIAAIAMDTARRAESSMVERLNTVTPREGEVLHGVARGRLNTPIAFDLGLIEATAPPPRTPPPPPGHTPPPPATPPPPPPPPTT